MRERPREKEEQGKRRIPHDLGLEESSKEEEEKIVYN
jgi:hypothetical protein